jgi:hypothetical protein
MIWDVAKEPDLPDTQIASQLSGNVDKENTRMS